MKREFLVLYDYGTGGIWAFLLADTEHQVRTRFPELRIVTERPSWLTEEEERLLRERLTVDIDDLAHPFLKSLIRGRERNRED